MFYQNKYRCELSVYLMKKSVFTFKISIYIAIGLPCHGKDVLDGIYEENIYILSNNLTVIFYGLDILNYSSSRSTVSFTDK